MPLIHRNAIVTDTVFLDISIGDDESVPSRRVTIGLYHDVTPKTCRTNSAASAIFALISLSTMGANAFAATFFASVTATSVFTDVAGFIGFRDGQWVGCCGEPWSKIVL